MLYRYCPLCGNKYDQRGDTIEDYPNSLKCSKCGKIFYNSPKPAAAGIIMDGDKILLTKRKYEPYKDCWDLPGGFVCYGENPFDTVKREIKEELNIDVKDITLNDIFSIAYPVSENDEISLNIITFLISCADISTLRPNDDVADFAFFDKDSLPKNIAFIEQEIYLKKLMANHR